jgi:hypothetical protein
MGRIPDAPNHGTPQTIVDWYEDRGFELCYMIFRNPRTMDIATSETFECPESLSKEIARAVGRAGYPIDDEKPTGAKQ